MLLDDNITVTVVKRCQNISYNNKLIKNLIALKSLGKKTVKKVLRLTSTNLISLLLNFSVNCLFSKRVILKNSLKINRVKFT